MGYCQPSGRKLRWTNNADGQVKKAGNLSSSFVPPLPTICSLCEISVLAEAIAEKNVHHERYQWYLPTGRQHSDGGQTMRAKGQK